MKYVRRESSLPLDVSDYAAGEVELTLTSSETRFVESPSRHPNHDFRNRSAYARITLSVC